ncbi:MAG: putative Ig domain-containing protein [Acidobacteriota bacterium]|nr:putative Ig domain-containing protein [Acidobacteriota bacterium]
MKFSRFAALAGAFLFSFSSGPAAASDIPVPSGGDISTAVKLAVPGDTIVLDAGGVYTTGSLELPEKGGPITIRSSASLPGRRVTPADRALLASVGSGNTAAVFTVTGSGWTIQGLAVRANSLGEGTMIDVIGNAANTIIDRNLFEGGAYGQKRAVGGNGGGYIRVSRNYMSNIWKQQQDSQGFASWDSPGPFEIVDNFIEAASENILFGGADSSRPERMPRQILVEGNHLTKNVAWKNRLGFYQVKNLFELKAGIGSIIRNNLMENNWTDAQSGWAILVTPRNQDGAATWTRIEDALFVGNTVRNVEHGISITGYDDLSPSGQTRRVTFRDNVIVTSGAFLQVAAEVGELTLDHNTVNNPSSLIKLYTGDIATATGRRKQTYGVGTFTIHNSLMKHGVNGYGIAGQDSPGNGIYALAYYSRSYDWKRNVVAGENMYQTYPPDTLLPTVAAHDANFLSDYTLVAGSSYRNAGADGTDLGRRFGTASTLTPTPTPTLTEPTPTEPTPTAPPPPPPPTAPQVVTPISITTASLADGVRRKEYTATLAAANAEGAVAWRVTSGALPAGLTLNATTGVISGMCDKPGNSTFVVSATDSGNSATRELSIQVRAR